MKFRSDKRGSKALLIVVLILILYLAFFGFNIKKAFEFTIHQDYGVFKSSQK